MAFADSILFNGKSIRDFLTEMIEVKGRGVPKIRKRSSRIIGRHGDFTFGQVFDSRIIRISGYIEGGSHATLMSNIDEIKNLFRMDDQILATGNESISDGVEYGKLEFGDESDRYYRAIYNGTNLLTEISQRWFSNDLKKIEIEFRCDDPFAYATSFSEATMVGSADEFKVFDLGTANNEVVVELNGSGTNPVIVEGDRVGVAHFDYDDDLSDVEVSTVSGNFTAAFGYRMRKSLTSQQSKGIQIVDQDKLSYDRGTQINGFNYTNFNMHQGTLNLWVKPYWDGDDGVEHRLFAISDGIANAMSVTKLNSNTMRFAMLLGSTAVIINSVALNSTNFAAGTWHQIVCRWDINNGISGTSNTLEIEINGGTPVVSTSSIGTPNGIATAFAIGQNAGTAGQNLMDGLIYWEFFERALTDSEVSDLFNSGAGIEPVVTPDTKLLTAGELSGDDPVSVQHPWVDNEFADGDQEVDPSTEWSVSAGSVTVTNETTIVKYDLQSAQIDWVSAAVNTYANLDTAVLVDNQEYFYRLWLYVESLSASDPLDLDIVGNSTVHNRQLNTGSDDLGVAYATGTWLYFEGTFEADGAVLHEFRIRKEIDDDDATVYLDQMECVVSSVDKGDFSGGFTGGLNDAWTQKGSGTPTQETTTVHSGANAQKFVTSAVDSGIQQAITFVADKWYTLSVWARGGASTDDLIVAVTGLSDAVGNLSEQFDDLGTTYVKKSITFKTGSDTSGTIEIYSPNNGDTSYYDDVSLIELDTVSANAATEVTQEINSYSEQKFDQGLLINGGDSLFWAIVGNQNEGSVEVWFTPQFDADWDNDTDEPTIFMLTTDANNFVTLTYDWTNDQWVFNKRTSSSNFSAVSAVQTFVKGQRIHIIGTYGSTNGVQIYVDSVAGTADNNTSALSGNPATLYMRESASAAFPDSIIDEIYAFSRELSQQEVTAKFNAIRATKNDNAKIAMTKVLSADDKLRIDTENEVIEFLDSSLGTFTNAIASMNAGSVFFKMNANKSVIYNKVALTNTPITNKIKLNYLKRWL